ncbi:MAG: hypothetical protein MUC83_08085 [Pirellula sp.]|nr:hypothetical protein [Pirellula sp.]
MKRSIFRIEGMVSKLRFIVMILLLVALNGMFGCRAMSDATSNGVSKPSLVYREASIHNADANLSGAPIRFISEQAPYERSSNVQPSDAIFTYDASAEPFGTRESIDVDPFGLSEIVPVEKERDSLLQRLLA